ncbi:MAG: xanthine dehydrogenase family protein molybdopterin-binding subunit [Candidatus Bathyarchaeia archaeon]
MSDTPNSYNLRRKEDPRLVAGLGHFLEDINPPRTVHLAILRSPYAHAKIKQINLSEATKRPGILLAVTGQDISNPLPSTSGLKEIKHFPLAREKVRHVGEPVAAIVANDRGQASDALDHVDVDYESLPVVVEAERALEKTAPVIHNEFSDNLGLHWKTKKGNVETAFKEAHVVLKERLVNQRLAPASLETRGVIAHYEAIDGSMIFWTSTQYPHSVRSYLSSTISVPEHKLRVIAPDVGGGFGSKADFYAEEALSAFLSMKLNRPVKWVEDRTENFSTTIHARDHVHYVEIAARKDGQISGLKDKIFADLGAYNQMFTPVIPILTAQMLPGAYKIPSIDIELLGAFTNRMSTDAYRGAGRPEATYIIERIIDLLARELRMDPAELRMRNFVQPDEFPFVTITGNEYDSGNYGAALNKALEIANYKQLRNDQQRLWKDGKYMGIGLCTYVEICGFGPSKQMGSAGYESATLRVNPSGKITVLTGSSPHGQGEETSFAQIVSEELGIPPENIAVVHGDTAKVPQGIGTFGSRSMAVGGSAVLLAARKVKDKVLKIAAHMLEASSDDMTMTGGKVHVKGSPEKTVTFGDVAEAANSANKLPPDLEPGLEETSFFDPPNYVFPFGAVVVVLEVDIETGKVEFKRFITVNDCGRVINPMLVEGQIHGGAAQGLGQALFEKVVYEENGQLLTSTLTDYSLPTALEMPIIESERTETPSPVNPLGSKGIGESATISSPPAVVNAIEDALRPFKVTIHEMPLRPHVVWNLIQPSRH